MPHPPRKGAAFYYGARVVRRDKTSVSIAVHVSPEGRSSEEAGARLARRDKTSVNLAVHVSPEGRSSEEAGARLARRGKA